MNVCFKKSSESIVPQMGISELNVDEQAGTNEIDLGASGDAPGLTPTINERLPKSGLSSGCGGNAISAWLTRRRVYTGAIVVSAWLVVALAWTTPTYMVEQAVLGTRITWGMSLVLVTVSFFPWMLATPGILKLARMFPFTARKRLRNGLLQVGIAALLIPGITAIGVLLTDLIWPVISRMAFSAQAWHYATNVTIDALYAVPTYIAVAGIGQAIAYSRRSRDNERLLARVQFQTLLRQLNPHFLFNVLNAVGTLGYDDPGKADRVLAKLASMLRTSLAEKGDEIALKEEIEWITDYTEIYRNLLPNDFRLLTDVEPDAWDAAVPRMILQPLVENAFVHGIAHCSGEGAIRLQARIIGERMMLTLSNSGTPSVPDERSDGPGIGLKNVSERLRVLYGGAQKMTLSRRASGEAVVEIKLPYRLADSVDVNR